MSKFFREINYLPEVKINKTNKVNSAKVLLKDCIDVFTKDQPEQRYILESRILKHSRKIVRFIEKSNFSNMEDDNNANITTTILFYLFILIIKPSTEWSEDFLNDLTFQFFRYGQEDLLRFTLQLVNAPGKKILSGYFARWKEIVLDRVERDYNKRDAKNLLLLDYDKDDEFYYDPDNQ